MKTDLFYLIVGSTIILPFVVLILSDEFIPALMGTIYFVLVLFIMPRKFWLRFLIANKHITKIWEG